MKTIRVLVTCTLIILAWSWLAGCRTAKPAPDRAAGTDLTGPYVPVVVRPDTTARLDSVVVTPHRSLVDKVLGRTKAKGGFPALPSRIGKKSTVSVYYGPATVTTTTIEKKATAATAQGATATSIGKAKGPTAIGDSTTATDNTKAGQRGGAAATAPGATATATTEKNGIPWWLWAGAAVVLAYVGYRKFSTF